MITALLIPQLEKYTRKYDAQKIVAVFDTYKKVSLKSLARKKRGKGIGVRYTFFISIKLVTISKLKCF